MQSILSAARAKKLDRVAAAYAVAGWLVVQAASIAFPTFAAPAWALRTFIGIVLIGFPVALFVAWFSIPHPHQEAISKHGGLSAGELTLVGLLGGVLLLSLAQLIYQFSGGARMPTALQSTASSSSSSPSKAASTTTGSLRVAIVPFDVIGTGSDATRAFADTLLDKVVGTLSANQVETVSRADSLSLRGDARASTLASLGVGLTLEGSVQNDGKTITVRLHLDDVRAHETLWSKEFVGTADSPEPLQTQVALHATDVTRWAVSPRLKDIRSDPSLVAAYLEGEDEQINTPGGGRALAIARDLVARAPRFAAAHTLLASAVGGEAGNVVVTPEAEAESVREAKIAIALDGGDGQAYALIADSMPLTPIAAREKVLLRGLSLEPGNPSANYEYIFQILAATGRLKDAVAQAQSAWQLVPFTEWVAWVLPIMLANAGRVDEGRDAIAEMKRKWPDNPDVFAKWAEISVESQKPPFARALALLDDRELRKPFERSSNGKPSLIDLLRTALKARSGTSVEKRAAAQLVEKSANDGNIINPSTAITTLSSLGDVDGAFRVADRKLTPEKIRHFTGNSLDFAGVDFNSFFGPLTDDFRRDRRFMVLAQRLGLVDYWVSTGHWPDFCSEPGLPYDCKTEAAMLASTALPGAKN